MNYFQRLKNCVLGRLNPGRKLIFLHIPKTGGTTFSAVIRKNINEERIFTATYDDPVNGLKRLPPDLLRKYDCIEGHISFGWHKRFGERCSYVTFLRHPVDRVISFYIHARTWSNHYLYSEVHRNPEKPMPIEEFVQSDLTVEVENCQVRLLCTEDGTPDFRPKLEPADLNRAIHHLDGHFSCIGLMEEYPRSLELMKRILGFSDVESTGRMNAAVSEVKKEVFQSIDFDVVPRLILERNQLDLALYQHARQSFDRLLDEHGISRRN